MRLIVGLVSFHHRGTEGTENQNPIRSTGAQDLKIRKN